MRSKGHRACDGRKYSSPAKSTRRNKPAEVNPLRRCPPRCNSLRSSPAQRNPGEHTAARKPVGKLNRTRNVLQVCRTISPGVRSARIPRTVEAHGVAKSGLSRANLVRCQHQKSPQLAWTVPCSFPPTLAHRATSEDMTLTTGRMSADPSAIEAVYIESACPRNSTNLTWRS